MRRCCLDLSGSEWGPEVGACKYGNLSSGFNSGEFLYQLSNYQLFNWSPESIRLHSATYQKIAVFCQLVGCLGNLLANLFICSYQLIFLIMYIYMRKYTVNVAFHPKHRSKMVSTSCSGIRCSNLRTRFRLLRLWRFRRFYQHPCITSRKTPLDCDHFHIFFPNSTVETILMCIAHSSHVTKCS